MSVNSAFHRRALSRENREKVWSAERTAAANHPRSPQITPDHPRITPKVKAESPTDHLSNPNAFLFIYSIAGISSYPLVSSASSYAASSATYSSASSSSFSSSYCSISLSLRLILILPLAFPLLLLPSKFLEERNCNAPHACVSPAWSQEQ